MADVRRIVMADGRTAEVGSKVFNYYDRYPVVIVAIDRNGWADCDGDDNIGCRAYLNGERLCSREFAKNKGWVK